MHNHTSPLDKDVYLEGCADFHRLITFRNELPQHIDSTRKALARLPQAFMELRKKIIRLQGFVDEMRKY